MRLLLWTSVFLLLVAAVVLAVYLYRLKNSAGLLPAISLADWVAIVSLLLNAALFVITIVSLLIAVAAYESGEKSSVQQQATLDQSRAALQKTADTLDASATHFKTSAESAAGQLKLLQEEKADREAAVLAVLSREVANNATTITENRNALATELISLRENKSLIGPIAEVHTEAWDLLKIYLPPQISGNATILTQVANTYYQMMRLKTFMQSREDYRIHNQAMDNFSRRMIFYDEQIIVQSDALSEQIRKLETYLPKPKS